MSRHSYFSMNGTLEYELHCDGCGTRFDCGDDSFYSWPVLRDAAEAEGWQVNADTAPHRCTDCRTMPIAPSAAERPGDRVRLAVR